MYFIHLMQMYCHYVKAENYYINTISMCGVQDYCTTRHCPTTYGLNCTVCTMYKLSFQLYSPPQKKLRFAWKCCSTVRCQHFWLWIERSGFWVTIPLTGLQTNQHASLQNVKYSLCKPVVLCIRHIVISRAVKKIMWYHWGHANTHQKKTKTNNQIVSTHSRICFICFNLSFFKIHLQFDGFDSAPNYTLYLLSIFSNVDGWMDGVCSEKLLVFMLVSFPLGLIKFFEF